MDPRTIRYGADNIARRFLAVAPNERVALLSWKADDLRSVVADAIAGAGGEPVLVELNDLAGASQARATTALVSRFAGCTASVLLAEHGIPPALSMATLDAVQRTRARHLHVTRVDARLFGQSYRADPDLIARINERVVSALEGARAIEVRSASGTELTVRLDARYPLIASDGRPQPGRPDNLPSGTVRFHPASIDGVLVADRGAIGAVRPDPALVRRYPLSFHFAQGRVERVECESSELLDAVEEYRSRDENAMRVGLVAVPTNYVVRSETGIEVQDALLPGVNVILGYSNAEATNAPFKCPVQLRLFGRRQDVVAGGVTLVDGGRLTDGLVGEIDPFR